MTSDSPVALPTPWRVSVVLQTDGPRDSTARLLVPAPADGRRCVTAVRSRALSLNSEVTTLELSPALQRRVQETVGTQIVGVGAGTAGGLPDLPVVAFSFEQGLLDTLSGEESAPPRAEAETYQREMQQCVDDLFASAVMPAIECVAPADDSDPCESAAVVVHAASTAMHEHVVIGTPSLLGLLPRAIMAFMDRVGTTESTEAAAQERGAGVTEPLRCERENPAGEVGGGGTANTSAATGHPASPRGRRFPLVEASFVALGANSLVDLLNLDNADVALRLSSTQQAVVAVPRSSSRYQDVCGTTATKSCLINGCSVLTVPTTDSALEVLDIGLENLAEAERNGAIASERSVTTVFVLRLCTADGMTATFHFVSIADDPKVHKWFVSASKIAARDVPIPRCLVPTAPQGSKRLLDDKVIDYVRSLLVAANGTPRPQLPRNNTALFLLPLFCHGPLHVSLVSCMRNEVPQEYLRPLSGGSPAPAAHGRLAPAELELSLEKLCDAVDFAYAAQQVWTLPITGNVAASSDSPLRRHAPSAPGIPPLSPHPLSPMNQTSGRPTPEHSPSPVSTTPESRRVATNALPASGGDPVLGDSCRTTESHEVLAAPITAVAEKPSVPAHAAPKTARNGSITACEDGVSVPPALNVVGLSQGGSPGRNMGRLPSDGDSGDRAALSPPPSAPLYPLNGDRDYENWNEHGSEANAAAFAVALFPNQTDETHLGTGAVVVGSQEPTSVSPISAASSRPASFDRDAGVNTAYPSKLPLLYLSAALSGAPRRSDPLGSIIAESNTSATLRLHAKLQQDLQLLRSANAEATQFQAEHADLEDLVEQFSTFFRTAHHSEKRVRFLEQEYAKVVEAGERERQKLTEELHTVKRELRTQENIQADLMQRLEEAQRRVTQLEAQLSGEKRSVTPTGSRTPRRLTPRGARGSSTALATLPGDALDDDLGEVVASPNTARLLRQMLLHMGDVIRSKGGRELLKHVDSVLGTSMECRADSDTTLYLINLLWDMTIDYAHQADEAALQAVRQHEEQLQRVKAVYSERFQTVSDQLQARQQSLLRNAHADYEAAIHKERQRTEALLAQVEQLKKMWTTSAKGAGADAKMSTSRSVIGERSEIHYDDEAEFAPQEPPGAAHEVRGDGRQRLTSPAGRCVPSQAADGRSPLPQRQANNPHQLIAATSGRRWARDTPQPSAAPPPQPPQPQHGVMQEWIPPGGHPRSSSASHRHPLHASPISRAASRPRTKASPTSTPMRPSHPAPAAAPGARRPYSPQHAFTNPPSVVDRLWERQNNIRNFLANPPNPNDGTDRSGSGWRGHTPSTRQGGPPGPRSPRTASPTTR